MENKKVFKIAAYTGLATYLLCQTALFGITAKPFYMANKSPESRIEMNKFINSLEKNLEQEHGKKGILVIKAGTLGMWTAREVFLDK